MNLEESDLFKEQLEKDTSRKRTIIIALIACSILIMVMIALIVYIKYVDKHTNKIFIDKTVSKKTIDYQTISAKELSDVLMSEYGWEEDDLPIYQEDPIYMNVKQLAEALGYEVRPGDYKKLDQDTNSVTMNNAFEFVSFTVGNEYYQKHLNVESESVMKQAAIGNFKGLQFFNTSEDYVENYKFVSPPIIIKEDIYVCIDDLDKMFNMRKDWSGEYWKYITTLNSLAKGIKLPSDVSSVSGYYENVRAIADGYIIVGDGDAKNSKTKYGAYKASSNSGEPFISIQYSNIIYQQNSEQFYIYNEEGKVGLAYDDGGKLARVVIKPGEYTAITPIDDKLNLYKVESNKEYGVVQKSDELKTIVNAEFSDIGYDYKKDFPSYDIGSKYVWYNKFIPVKKGGKLGLYKIEGTGSSSLQALPVSFDGFGYISDEVQQSGNEENLLIIPPETGIFGLVISRNDRYGVYDLNTEKVVVPCNCKKFYALTKGGITTYHCLPDEGNDVELSNYFSNIDGNGTSIKNVDKDGRYIGERSIYTRDDEEEEVFDVDKFNEGFTSYEGKQNGSGVKVLINNLIKNARDNSKDIDKIPSVEYYQTIGDSEMIDPSRDENEQETYISELQSIMEEITRQTTFNVSLDYKNSGIVSNVVIERVENEDTEVIEE